MPLSDQQLRAMHECGVLVATHAGETIAMGTLRAAADSPSDAAPRLDLHFETELLRCVLRVPAVRLDALAASWDGAMYRYALPADDHVWLPRKHGQHPPPPATPVIETFALPEEASHLGSAVKLSGAKNRGPR